MSVPVLGYENVTSDEDFCTNNAVVVSCCLLKVGVDKSICQMTKHWNVLQCPMTILLWKYHALLLQIIRLGGSLYSFNTEEKGKRNMADMMMSRQSWVAVYLASLTLSLPHLTSLKVTQSTYQCKLLHYWVKIDLMNQITADVNTKKVAILFGYPSFSIWGDRNTKVWIFFNLYSLHHLENNRLVSGIVSCRVG